MTNKPKTLEQRISAALTDSNITSTDLEALIIEVNEQLIVGKAAARDERERLLHPATVVNNAARSALEDMDFAVARLENSLDPLAHRLNEIQIKEIDARWLQRYAETKQIVEAAALRFQKYKQLSTELAALMQDAAETDKLIGDINATAPPGHHERIYSVEQTARGIKSYSRENPEIARALVLPDFDHSSDNLYPARYQLDPMFYAAPPQSISTTDRWWEPQEAARIERARLEAEQRLVDAEGLKEFYRGR